MALAGRRLSSVLRFVKLPFRLTTAERRALFGVAPEEANNRGMVAAVALPAARSMLRVATGRNGARSDT